MTKPKIYFLGSGDIAVPVLEILARSPQVELMGAGTQVDRPAGRKRRLVPTPVGAAAEALGLEIAKIPNVNAPEFLAYLKELCPDIILVISFGQLLKAEILELPRAACVNIHASLLPEYRGASPITAAILNGATKTGVGFMKMDRGLDTGPVYCQFEHILTGAENAGKLESGLGKLAADNCVEVLRQIVTGNLSPVPQDDSKASLTRKISKQDGELDWNENAIALERKVRAYFPWPGLNFNLRGQKRETKIRITEAAVNTELAGEPGVVLQADKHGWTIACATHALELRKIVPAGKKEMTGAEFLRGCPVATGIKI